MALKDPRSSRAWRRLRDQVVREEPSCQLRFKSICTGYSQTADHIIPVRDRPDLALTRSNVRGACHACNNSRSAMPDDLTIMGGAEQPRALDVFAPRAAARPAPRPRGRVTLVAGPPCAGKSTHVEEHASPDALVVCWDRIALELGAPIHPTPYRMRRQIAAEYDARLTLVEHATEAWVIRSLPDPLERRAWVDRLRADLVLLVPPTEVLMARARRRPDPGKTMQDIRAWLAAQRPAQHAGRQA